jgi:hypothetical protein
MSAVPEPMFLLLLGFVMIGLSVRFRSSRRKTTVPESGHVQTRTSEPIGKTVPA